MILCIFEGDNLVDGPGVCRDLAKPGIELPSTLTTMPHGIC